MLHVQRQLARMQAQAHDVLRHWLQALEDLPHVSKCSLCMRCVADEPHMRMRIRTEDLKPEHFMPTDMIHKQKLPICPECRGCTDQLTVLVCVVLVVAPAATCPHRTQSRCMNHVIC